MILQTINEWSMKTNIIDHIFSKDKLRLKVIRKVKGKYEVNIWGPNINPKTELMDYKDIINNYTKLTEMQGEVQIPDNFPTLYNKKNNNEE